MLKLPFPKLIRVNSVKTTHHTTTAYSQGRKRNGKLHVTPLHYKLGGRWKANHFLRDHKPNQVNE